LLVDDVVVVDKEMVVVEVVGLVVVVGDLRVEVVEKDCLMIDRIYFGITIGQTLIIYLEGQTLKLLDHHVQDLPFNSTNSYRKTLQSIIVSCHYQKVAKVLISLDADKKANNAR